MTTNTPQKMFVTFKAIVHKDFEIFVEVNMAASGVTLHEVFGKVTEL